MLIRRLFQLSLPALAVAFLLGGCRSSQTNDPAAKADAFFALLGAGKVEEAYASAAFGFRAQESLRALNFMSDDLGLPGSQAPAWEKKQIDGKQAELTGTVTNSAGKKIPFTVKLALENGEWKIYALHPSTGNRGVNRRAIGFRDNFDKPIPPDDEIVALVHETFAKFNQSIQEKSFTTFYDYIADAGRENLSVKRLQRTFQPFIDMNLNLAVLQEIQPVFYQKPHVDTDGFLVLNGYFPSQPYRTDFSFKYAWELPHWKLIDIAVNLIKPEEPRPQAPSTPPEASVNR